jgi:hypothetical protein
MPALGADIRALTAPKRNQGVDGRDKPGHDGHEEMLCRCISR